MPEELADGESLVELHRRIEQLRAAAARAAAAFDASRAWEADGARSAAAWIATRCRLPLRDARREVRLGRALRRMPETESSWLLGDVGEAQVDLLVMARRRAPERFSADEERLVEHARTLRHRDFAKVVAYWVQVADPDGADREAEQQRDDRRLHLSQSLGGRWFLDGLLDPISGEIVSRALTRIERELFEADWAAAKRAKGEDVCAADLARTPAQRRVDALVELARRAGAAPADGRPPRPLFSVFVGYETLAGRICELANGAVVAPAAVAPWLTEADIERVVFDGPDRVKNVGVHRRFFTGATRRAVEVRDRECFHEFCDQPAETCDIDHLRPHAEGGPTHDDNGRPACGYHNRRRNQPP